VSKSFHLVVCLVVAAVCLCVGKRYVDRNLNRTKEALIMILEAQGVHFEEAA